MGITNSWIQEDIIVTKDINPTVDTSAYAVGDCLCSLIEVTNAVKYNGGTGILNNITVGNYGTTSPELDIFIFDSNPSNSTFTKNSAPSFNKLDMPKILQVTNINNWDDANGRKIGSYNSYGNLLQDRMFSCASGSSSIYLLIVTRSIITPSSTTDFTIKLNIMQK